MDHFLGSELPLSGWVPYIESEALKTGKPKSIKKENLNFSIQFSQPLVLNQSAARPFKECCSTQMKRPCMPPGEPKWEVAVAGVHVPAYLSPKAGRNGCFSVEPHTLLPEIEAHKASATLICLFLGKACRVGKEKGPSHSTSLTLVSLTHPALVQDAQM